MTRNLKIWTAKELAFIRRNYTSMSNIEMAVDLGVKLSTLRKKCYEIGLKRMELQYWTTAQVRYLIENYQTMGDSELAEVFNKKWEKEKGWTKKHIEKKRHYLNLRRTKGQRRAIHVRNVAQGKFAMCPVKAWDKRGRAKEGEIRVWARGPNKKRVAYIKVDNRFIPWGPYAWEREFGKVPKGMNVVFRDGDPSNTIIDNLELVSDADLARRNSVTSSQGLSDNYVAGIITHGDRWLRREVKKDADLIDFKRQQLLINRQINKHEKQNHRSA